MSTTMTNTGRPVTDTTPGVRAGRRARGLSLLLILVWPCAAFVLTGIAERADRPAWRWSAYDPQFYYLMDSVSISEGHAPGVYHHPGTPVQILGGAILTGRHVLTGAPGASLRKEVLDDPLAAIHAISVALRLLHAVALGVMGFAAWRLTGSSACAVAAQIATLASVSSLTCTHYVMPESLMLSIGLVLSASVMMCLARPQPVRTRFGVISGALAAVGTMAKLTFAPACLVVWGVMAGSRPGARRLVLVHLATAAIAVPILLAPIVSHFGTMVRWFTQMAVHDGYYGRSTGYWFINPETYLGQLSHLVRAEPVLAGVTLACVILSAALFIPILAHRLDDQGRRARLVLVALAAAQGIQFLLVAKHMVARHMIPAIGLSGLAVCLALILTRAVLPRPQVRWTLVTVAILGLAYGSLRAYRDFRGCLYGARELSARQVALARDAEALASRPGQPGSGAVLVYTFWSSAPAYAFRFGDYGSVHRFGDELAEMFPDRMLYARSINRYSNMHKQRVMPEQLQAWAAEGRLYFHMRRDELPADFRFDTVVDYGGQAGGLFKARLPAQ